MDLFEGATHYGWQFNTHSGIMSVVLNRQIINISQKKETFMKNIIFLFVALFIVSQATTYAVTVIPTAPGFAQGFGQGMCDFYENQNHQQQQLQLMQQEYEYRLALQKQMQEFIIKQNSKQR